MQIYQNTGKPVIRHEPAMVCACSKNSVKTTSVGSPDQYVRQGAQQAEGGDWSEISQQQAGQQKHQRHQGTH